MTRVLFVCLGNICRSPAAEGVLKHLATRDPEFQNLHIRSCGMGSWYAGQLPDDRIRSAAKARGIDLISRAQLFDPNFLDEYDYIFAADHEVMHHLYRHTKTPEQKSKIHLFTAFSSSYPNAVIPDPFYQGDAAFDDILDIIEDSCEGFLTHLKKQKTK
jgi:protein-tyrosine phosphatase